MRSNWVSKIEARGEEGGDGWVRWYLLVEVECENWSVDDFTLVGLQDPGVPVIGCQRGKGQTEHPVELNVIHVCDTKENTGDNFNRDLSKTNVFYRLIVIIDLV